FDGSRRLLVWKDRYQQDLQFPDGFLQVGLSNWELSLYVAERGDYGEGDPEKLTGERLNLLWGGDDTRSEITILGEKNYDVLFRRTDDGGLVITFTDITERKRAEEALRVSEQRLANAQRLAHLGHWDWDIVSGNLYMSDEASRIYGFEPQAFPATLDACFQAVHPDDRDRVSESVDQTISSGQPFDNEFRILRPDGTLRHVHERGEASFGDNGAPVRMIGTVYDITERKEAEEALQRAHDELEIRILERTSELRREITERKLTEEALREREALLTHAQDVAKVGYWVWYGENISDWDLAGTSSGKKPILSDQFRDIFGITDSQDRVATWRTHTDDSAQFWEVFRKAEECHEAYSLEYRTVGDDGDIRFVREFGDPRHDPETGQRIWLGVVQDITESKQAEKGLRESEERFRTVVDHSPAKIHIKDANGRYVLLNRQAERLFGITDESARGKTTHEIFPQAQADAFATHDQAVLQSGETIEQEEEWLQEDGVHTFLTVKFPIRDASGKVVSVGAIGTDITERKQAEQEIQKLNEDLERRVEERTAELRAAQDTLLQNERLATLGQLTATVSHELRNPLGVIRTSAFTLRGKLTGGEPRAERTLDRIERNVVRCDRIIDELLDFTRISQLEPKPTSLEAWLEETLNEQTLPSGVALRLAFDRPDMAVSLDHDRFRRAIINVFDNACQAMIGDGLEDADSDEHILTVRTQESDGRIEVIFEDTGPGIPPDVYQKIFEPLYSTKGFGMGLGLPVVKQIMEQHGGGIEIDSEEGRGTKVCLWLPTSPSTC
ncbi:MAG: PAS domain S-box protein, partial [Nitrospirae bacterium]|nr:PAS domain S-box protein [Nitrospirota bacterium]